MREIKFRQWNTDENEYFYADPGTIDWECLYDVENMEQYTGLKDVNGKEIYEGDFVHITGEHWIARMPITDDYYSAVFFEGGMFAVKSDEEPGKHIPDGNFGYGTCHQIRPLAELVEEQSMNDMSVEVLGNIHENPELLEDME